MRIGDLVEVTATSMLTIPALGLITAVSKYDRFHVQVMIGKNFIWLNTHDLKIIELDTSWS